MGPFVPSVISDQMSLVLALFIGIAFGYVLEQAGFSSAKRLVGLFYGYDFTVLRVFFTAAVTAVLGILALGFFGYLDLSAIYVNPLFLKPAIVGGAIMGVGFILGGYCPGTSVAALSIGKVDALFFVLGGLLGVMAYAEVYPSVQAFADSTAMGPVLVYDSLGVGKGPFVFALVAMAVGAFVAAGFIERKVNPEGAPSKLGFSRWHYPAAALALLAGLAAMVLPDRQHYLLQKVSDPEYAVAHPVDTIDSDELAILLVEGSKKIKVYDLRPEAEFNKLSVPGAANIKLSDLFTNEYVDDFARRHVRKVLVAETQAEAEQAARLLESMGYVNLSALKGGFGEFRRTILDPAETGKFADVKDPVVREFRQDAQRALLTMIKQAKEKNSGQKKPQRKVQGGC